jgi:hypothetical protein
MKTPPSVFNKRKRGILPKKALVPRSRSAPNKLRFLALIYKLGALSNMVKITFAAANLQMFQPRVN